MTRVEKKQGQRLRRERQREGNAPDLFPRHLLFPQECSDTHTPSRPFSYVITKVIFSVLYYFLPRDRMMSPRQSKQKICDPSASLFISGAGEELGGSDWILTLLTCQSAPQRRRFISLSLSLFRLFFVVDRILYFFIPFISPRAIAHAHPLVKREKCSRIENFLHSTAPSKTYCILPDAASR